MLKRIIKNVRKNGKLGNALALGLAMSVAVGSSAFALNYTGTGGSGNKPVNFSGYEYVSSTAIDVFFNKQISATTGSPVIPQSYFIDKSLFSIVTHGGAGGTTPDSITIDTSASDGTDSDTTDTGFLKGTRVRLYFSGGLSTDTLYDLTIKGTFMDSNGITLGNYAKGKDFKFTLRTPSSGTSTWSNTTPYVTFNVGDSSSTSNVSWESNAILIFDRPISTGSLSSYLSSLNTNFVNNTASKGVVANGEAFTPSANDKRSLANTFYFAETKQGNAAGTALNRTQSSNSYTLTLPTSFTDYSGNTFTTFVDSGSNSTVTSYPFSTVSTDYAGWENTGNPLVYLAQPTAGTGSLTVTWPISQTYSITPAPGGWNVYYIIYDNDSTALYKSIGSWTKANIATLSSATSSYTITGLSNTHSYWVRVEPTNSTNLQPVGLSVSQQTASTPN